MIVNLRGAHGSGKTYVAKQLLERWAPVLPQYDGSGRVIGYRTSNGVYIIGKYDPERHCGGCDGFRDRDGVKAQDQVCDLIRQWAPRGDVFFEGMVAAGTFGRWFDLEKELKAELGTRWVWAFLDTPLQKCLENIQIRNGGKPIIESHVVKKFKAVESTRKKALEAGLEVRVISHLKPVDNVMALITTIGEEAHAPDCPGHDTRG
jgi:shikimate kinase